MDRSVGLFLVLSSTIIYASLTPLLKKANQVLPPFAVMAISMAVLFLLSLIFSLFFENFAQLKLSQYKGVVKILILVGILNTIAFYLAVKAFKYLPIWQQQMFTVLTPVLSGIFAYFILGEAFSSKLFLGLAIMTIGLFLALT
jgi:drug/metabolite transporter (DMT)-like permease